jgi:hypothetical protein
LFEFINRPFVKRLIGIKEEAENEKNGFWEDSYHLHGFDDASGSAIVRRTETWRLPYRYSQ